MRTNYLLSKESTSLTAKAQQREPPSEQKPQQESTSLRAKASTGKLKTKERQDTHSLPLLYVVQTPRRKLQAYAKAYDAVFPGSDEKHLPADLHPWMICKSRCGKGISMWLRLSVS